MRRIPDESDKTGPHDLPRKQRIIAPAWNGLGRGVNASLS
jgi:hypothetical protein